MRETRGGKGSLGRIISDTSLAVNLNKSILDLDSAANSFDENMEAMRHSWPFKKYFRKKNSR
jgi:phospholipid/cholesterol/gamma-HCH transport system substrate-binding protein